jgi:hypothetical protein
VCLYATAATKRGWRNKMNSVSKEKEINYCKSFTDHLTDKIGFENKVRYLLENFLFEDGWASKGNQNVGKDGYSHQYCYNYADLRHFVEDMVRWAVEQKRLED